MEPKDTARGREATLTLVLSTLMRRIIIGLSGGLVLIVGVAMTVLPGPAFVVVPLGLAILATEFAWARRMMHRFRDVSERAIVRMRLKKWRERGAAERMQNSHGDTGSTGMKRTMESRNKHRQTAARE